ncbi:hypothetical protein IAR50_002307 [Cryptococcus sp. DSM 104548]
MTRPSKHSTRSNSYAEDRQERYTQAPSSFAPRRSTPSTSASTPAGGKTPRASSRRSSKGSQLYNSIASNLPGFIGSFGYNSYTDADPNATFAPPAPEDVPWDWKNQNNPSAPMGDYDGASVYSLSSFSGGDTSGEEGRAYYVAEESGGGSESGGRRQEKKVVASHAEKNWTLLSNDGRGGSRRDGRYPVAPVDEEEEGVYYRSDDDLASSAMFTRRTRDEDWESGLKRSGGRDLTEPGKHYQQSR